MNVPWEVSWDEQWEVGRAVGDMLGGGKSAVGCGRCSNFWAVGDGPECPSTSQGNVYGPETSRMDVPRPPGRVVWDVSTKQGTSHRLGTSYVF